MKTRIAGRATFIEFHLIVDGDMSVRESHVICDRIEEALRAEIPSVRVTIHVEPDDEGQAAAGHQRRPVRVMASGEADLREELPSMPAEVAAAFASYPLVVASTLADVRLLIFATAAETESVGPLTETLKWGEPAYLTGTVEERQHYPAGSGARASRPLRRAFQLQHDAG